MTFLTPKTALASGLTALALGCTAIAAHTDDLTETGLSCTVDVTARGAMLTIEGVVTTQETLSGTYQMRVARGGTVMNQGGPFALRAGDSERLGRVMLNGPASGLEVELTLDAEGRTTRCPVDL